MSSTPLANAYFLRGLGPRERSKIEALAIRRSYRSDETIIELDGEVDSLFVIDAGLVRVVLPVDHAGTTEEELLVKMGAGDCFGEFSFVDRRHSSARIVAHEPTTVWALPYIELDRVLAGDAHLALKVTRAVLEMVVGRMRATDADLAMARYVVRYV